MSSSPMGEKTFSLLMPNGICLGRNGTIQMGCTLVLDDQSVWKGTGGGKPPTMPP